MSFAVQLRTGRGHSSPVLASLFILALVLTGCPATLIHGNGEEATEWLQHTDFTEIEVGTFADTNVVLGSGFEVSITCDANLLQYFTSRVVGARLIIDHAQRYGLRPNIAGGCHIDIEVPLLTRLSNAGSGTMSTDDVIVGLVAVENLGSGQVLVAGAVRPFLELDVANTGSGRAEVNGVDVHDLRGSLDGSGTVFLAGGVRDAVFVSTSSGVIDAQALIAETVAVTLTGSGDVVVHATDGIVVVLRGSGDVIVHGSPPSRDVTINGSGSVVYE